MTLSDRQEGGSTLRVIPLGGLGEIGMNMMAMEYGDSIIVIDAGVMFPDDYFPGIDLIIPDITYLEDNREKVKAILITHGHEDHIGALPFIQPRLRVPIYAPPLAHGFIENKFREFDLLKSSELISVTDSTPVRAGDFSVEYIPVCHSIVDACSLAITTPLGTVIHTGDFKFDDNPVTGSKMDIDRFKDYGDRGVLALFSDSTNVERDGFTGFEADLKENLLSEIEETEGMVVAAAFSSNIHRIQMILECATETKRSVVLAGRSMISNIGIAKSLGHLHYPPNLIIDLVDVADHHPSDLLVLTTGTQGEPLSALTRISTDMHKQIKLKEGDKVILSSKFIPGNEKSISNMINHLYRRGATVVTEKSGYVHVSGHGAGGELARMIDLTRPRFFTPIHGEYRHLIKHGRLAEGRGIKEENVHIAENGAVVEFYRGAGGVVRCRPGESVDVGKVLVDGAGLGGAEDIVLKDRRHLSRDGLVLATVAIDEHSGDIVYGPDIVTRGLVFEGEHGSEGELMGAVKDAVTEAIYGVTVEVRTDPVEVHEVVRLSLRRFFNTTLRRRPVILPLILEL